MDDITRRVLVRAVLEPAFLERLLEDAEGALADYDLPPEVRDALAARDARVLDLMGLGPATAPPAPEDGTADPPAAEIMQIRLCLQVPFSLEGSEGGTEMHFAPVLSLLDAETDPRALTAPELDTDVLPGVSAGMCTLELRIIPTLIQAPGEVPQVVCTHAVSPVSGAPMAVAAPPRPDIASEVGAVRAAATADRTAAVETLIATLEGALHG
ncbi:MAG: hypothetical protein AAGI50_16470 [Pseudomonadota bacterium]